MLTFPPASMLELCWVELGDLQHSADFVNCRLEDDGSFLQASLSTSSMRERSTPQLRPMVVFVTEEEASQL